MLEIKGLTKHFRNVAALSDVNFRLRAGEVHALLGENGAGKSTLINLIVGTFEPTAGELVFDGTSYAQLNPTLARSLGVASVFQEFSLVPDLTVLENLFLARETTGSFFLKKSTMRQQAQKLLEDLEFPVPLDIPVGHLSRAQKQMVEIAKALRLEPRILILDDDEDLLFHTQYRLKKRLCSSRI